MTSKEPDFSFSAEDIEIHHDPITGLEVDVYNSGFSRVELNRLISSHWDEVVILLQGDFGSLYELAEPLMCGDESDHCREHVMKSNWNDWHKEAKP